MILVLYRGDVDEEETAVWGLPPGKENKCSIA